MNMFPESRLAHEYLDGLNGFTPDIFENGRDQGVQEERETL